MAPTDDLLAEARRGLFALTGPQGPLVWPMAFWWDGAGLWMTAPLDSLLVRRLRRTDRGAMWVPPLAGNEPGAVVAGSARLFSVQDPLPLALHGPAISGALAALALRNAPGLSDWAQHAARAPSRLLPHSYAVIRLAVEGVRGVVAPRPPAGVAPAIPTVIPPDVRRRLAGIRQIAVAVVRGGAVDLDPAAWSGGFALSFPGGRSPAPGDRLAAALDLHDVQRPALSVGLALSGRLRPPAALAVERATWWRGSETGTADVPAAASPGIELPD